MIMKTLLGFFILITLLSGCSVRHVNESVQNTTPVHGKQEAPNESVQNTTPVHGKQEAPKEDFIPGFNPFKDDPDNPSPHNPLVRKFGDIPEVRTYIRLKQKLYSGIGLNIDEAIELYAAEAHLYPSDATKANLKKWKKDKERYQRLGIPMGGPVLTFTGTSDEKPAVNEVED